MQVEVLNKHIGSWQSLKSSWAGRFYIIKMVDERGVLIVCRSCWEGQGLVRRSGSESDTVG